MTRREQLVDDAAEVAALLEQPDEDAQLVDELGDVPDDDSPTPTPEQVRVAALLCAHATSGTDLDDLAGVLGVRHAVEPAERWLNALSRAAAEPRPPMAQALLEHLVPIDAVVLEEDDAAAHEVEFDADDGSTYPCANGGDCGCVGTGLLSCPGRDEDARRRAADRAAEVAAAVRAVVYPNPIDEPDEIVPIWLCEQGQHEACNGYACPCCASGQCPAYPTPLPEPQPVDEQPATVLPTGPQPCEVCGLNVTAQKIAETGRARHPWHPED